ncbi:hypothetical protein EfmAA290_24030 [Enterococcus faecium]|nr:hypothetical protein EfmAA290_24030 [Enterococcus faecium]
MRKYTFVFKKKVVSDYLNNEGGYKYLAHKYQINRTLGNLALLPAFFNINESIILKGDVPYNFADLAGKTVTISVEIEVKNAQPQTSGVDFRIGCEASIPRASGGTFYLGVWEKLSAGQGIVLSLSFFIYFIPNDIVATQNCKKERQTKNDGAAEKMNDSKIEILLSL